MQLELLKQSVNSAVASVPFYSNFGPIDSFEDLQQFPIIRKKDFVERQSEFLSRIYRKNALHANTGGSSGTPMEFFLHAGRTRPKERAHFDWFWGQVGYTSQSRVLMIRGAALKGNALYEYQRIKNCLAVSCYEINSSNIVEVLRQVGRFRPDYIHGYPSAVRNFMQCIMDSPHATWNFLLRGLFLGSEMLSPADRATLESFFESKVMTWYGHSECAVMGGNSPNSNELHFYPFYGFTELVDDQNQPIRIPGQTGRIIATSFDNYVMPFIRYDTGDQGTLSSVNDFHGMPCLVLSRIEGRAQDSIYLSDGTKVSLTAFIFGQHLPEFARIREMQLEQHVAGEILLRIIRGSNFRNEDIGNIIRRLKKSVSNKISIEFECVERIEKTHRGKHRFLIQGVTSE